MESKKSIFEILGVFCAVFLTLFICFPEQISNPAHLLFAAGDGAKNYFTFLFHIVFDENYWRFDGMNYPFGENVIFTDNQPLLANFIKLTHKYYNFNTKELLFLHNISLFLGTAFGGVGIFLCLKKLKTDFWFAFFCTLGLIIIQPQIQRFQSHYSMVYPVLPWIFYCWFSIWENNKVWPFVFAILILNIIFGLTHMYHFLTISVVCVFGISLSLFTDKLKNHWIKISSGFFIMVFIPFFIIYTSTSFIEPQSDRPSKVWGFFSYNSSWEGLLFSHKHPIYHFINDHVTKIRSLDQVEAFNYIGIISVIFLLYYLFASIKSWRKIPQNLKNSLTTEGKLGWIFLLSALMSFGLPFTIKGLGCLLDYSGPYQQFRAIGRIGWISFYAINFITIPSIWKWVQNKNKWLKYPIWVLVPLTLIWEGYILKPDLTNPEHLAKAYNKSLLPQSLALQDYQCIIPDPYLHAGSESFHWAPVGLNQDQFFEVAYNSGLPSMATILSRTSLKQSALLNQLVCPPYEIPQIVNLLKEKDNRPILVLESKLELYNYNSSISHWTKGTEIVYENPEFRLRKLPLQHFDTIVARFQDSLALNPVDTLYKISLPFEHSKKEKTWGYEAIMYCDSLTRGDAIFAVDIGIAENKDVNAIIEVWQITKEHQNAEQFSVRANYHYKKLSPKHMYIELPMFIKPETDKIAIRMYKDNQKEKDMIKFWNARLFSIRRYTVTN